MGLGVRDGLSRALVWIEPGALEFPVLLHEAGCRGHQARRCGGNRWSKAALASGNEYLAPWRRQRDLAFEGGYVHALLGAFTGAWRARGVTWYVIGVEQTRGARGGRGGACTARHARGVGHGRGLGPPLGGHLRAHPRCAGKGVLRSGLVLPPLRVGAQAVQGVSAWRPGVPLLRRGLAGGAPRCQRSGCRRRGAGLGQALRRGRWQAAQPGGGQHLRAAPAQQCHG